VEDLLCGTPFMDPNRVVVGAGKATCRSCAHLWQLHLKAQFQPNGSDNLNLFTRGCTSKIGGLESMARAAVCLAYPGFQRKEKDQ
jgi:hypothetical protein